MSVPRYLRVVESIIDATNQAGGACLGWLARAPSQIPVSQSTLRPLITSKTKPQSQTGAISHRADQSQYWADFIFMVPPYLAYYAEMTNNRTLMSEAVRQISLYRDFLRREPQGLWAHIQGGQGNLDPGLWATGNAWAAYGMMRVHATIQRGRWSGEMQGEMGQLRGWVGEIMDGVKASLVRLLVVWVVRWQERWAFLCSDGNKRRGWA